MRLEWKRVSLVLFLAVFAVAIFAVMTGYRARALSTMPVGTSALVPSLTEQLRNPKAERRAHAAVALSGMAEREVTTALLATLGDEDPEAGYAAAMALSHSQERSVADSLVAELASQDPVVRQRAALALSRMEVPGAVPALAAALTESSTAQGAAHALVRSTAVEAHAALLEALADAELTTRRHAVMTAIVDAGPSTKEMLLARALSSENLILKRNALQLQEIMAPSN